MTNPLSAALIAWGAVFRPAQVAPGQKYWRLVQADGPMDIGGNHHLYVDAWDENGNRLVDVPVRFYSLDEEWIKHTEAKPGEPYSINLPLYAGGNAYGVQMHGAPSDDLFGVGLGHMVAHHAFRAIFQWSTAQAETTPPPDVVPPGPQPPDIITPLDPNPMTVADVIEVVQFYLDMLRRMQQEGRR